MKIRDFGVEMWMNAYENNCTYNLAETCVKSLTVQELAALSGKGDKVWEDIRAMQLTYGDIEGSMALREGLCGLYKTVRPENTTITHGAIGANDLVINALVEPGDTVISVLPTYQQLYSIPESLGARVKICQLRPENGFLPDLAELESLVDSSTKLICINNPNNPTGALMDEALLRFRACGTFHAFPQGPFVSPLRTFPHCHAIGALPFHDKAATTQMGGQIRMHCGDLCFGHVLGEHAVAHGGAFGSQADNIASRGVADHGDGKGSVLHYVRAEPHCTLLCASWDSALSMMGGQCRLCVIAHDPRYS